MIVSIIIYVVRRTFLVKVGLKVLQCICLPLCWLRCNYLATTGRKIRGIGGLLRGGTVRGDDARGRHVGASEGGLRRLVVREIGRHRLGRLGASGLLGVDQPQNVPQLAVGEQSGDHMKQATNTLESPLVC